MFLYDFSRAIEPDKFINAPPSFVLLNVEKINVEAQTNIATSPSVKQLPVELLIGGSRYVIPLKK